MIFNCIVNNFDLVVEDMLCGVLVVYFGLFVYFDNLCVLCYCSVGMLGCVGIVIGGGFGYELVFFGYVGQGLVDVVVVGEVFFLFIVKFFMDVFQLVYGGQGIVCLYGNYVGDNMNVKMVIKLVECVDIQVCIVVVNDDVVLVLFDQFGKWCGVVGEILMWKVGGVVVV